MLMSIGRAKYARGNAISDISLGKTKKKTTMKTTRSTIKLARLTMFGYGRMYRKRKYLTRYLCRVFIIHYATHSSRGTMGNTKSTWRRTMAGGCCFFVVVVVHTLWHSQINKLLSSAHERLAPRTYLRQKTCMPFRQRIERFKCCGYFFFGERSRNA